ncbi:MAG: hypothetical protein ABI356_11235 [Steroidobacteraceae bacterium]
MFKAGIERVLAGAEKEPLDCHRTLLVSRALGNAGASITHILSVANNTVSRAGTMTSSDATIIGTGYLNFRNSSRA